jgi:iron complex transport system substrate-binding protein
MRVVSLIASSTEIVCALGFEESLVGISHECDFPESIRRLPVCSETKFLSDGTSYEIDQRIKAILQEGLSIYRVKGEQLKKLQPDVIITQTQCEVCAVSEKDVFAATCDFLESHPKIVSMNTNSLSDL